MAQQQQECDFPLSHHISDIRKLSQPLPDAQSRQLSVVRGDPFTFKTTRVPHALRGLRPGCKVLCLQPDEYAAKRAGTHVQRLGLKETDSIHYTDAWSSDGDHGYASDATLVYASVQWVLAESLPGDMQDPTGVDESMFQDFSFIIFDEAHCGTKEYYLALALILHQHRCSKLRADVKIILMSSYMRDSSEMSLMTRTKIAQEYYLRHDPDEAAAAPVQAPSFSSTDITIQQHELGAWIDWVCECLVDGHAWRALVFVPFADFRWTAQALKAELVRRHCIDADKIHVRDLHSTMETELSFGADQDFVLLAPAHTNGAHVYIPELAHVVYPHRVDQVEFDRAVSKQVIRRDSRELASWELRFLLSYGGPDPAIQRSVTCTEKTYHEAIASVRPEMVRQDALEYVFLAYALFRGYCPFARDLAHDQEHPADRQGFMPLPLFFDGAIVNWALTRLQRLGQKLITIQYQPERSRVVLTGNGWTAAYLMLATGLTLEMTLLVMFHMPMLDRLLSDCDEQGRAQYACMVATALAYSSTSTSPLLRLRHQDYAATPPPSRLTPSEINRFRDMVLASTTHDDNAMGNHQVPSQRDKGEVLCDMLYLGLRLSGRLSQDAQPAPVGGCCWIDTSMAAEERQKFIVASERIASVLGIENLVVSDMQPLPISMPDDGGHQTPLDVELMSQFWFNWAKAHVFNLAFVDMAPFPDRSQETFDTITELVAIDLCSSRTVKLDAKTALDFSLRASHGFQNGFMVVYSTIRELSSGEYQISGLSPVANVYLKDLGLTTLHNLRRHIGSNLKGIEMRLLM